MKREYNCYTCGHKFCNVQVAFRYNWEPCEHWIPKVFYTDPFDMTNQELREEHNALHFGRVPPDKERHDEIAKEIIRRGYVHNTGFPLDTPRQPGIR